MQNIIKNIVLTCTCDHITINNLPEILFNSHSDDLIPISLEFNKSFDNMVMDYEKKIITSAYNKFSSSYKVANHLNISQSKANRLIRKYVDNKIEQNLCNTFVIY